jgi:hypothetical protein
VLRAARERPGRYDLVLLQFAGGSERDRSALAADLAQAV